MRALHFITCLGILSLGLGGCGNKNDQTLGSLESGVVQKKPRVAFVPTLDHSHHRLGWNVAGELTAGIYETLQQKDHCQLTNLNKIKNEK